MTYTLQKDVALVTVCDEHFLVAAGQARGKVPAVKGINRPGAYFWNLLQQKLPDAVIYIQSILTPTAAGTESHAGLTPERIARVNERLKSLAEEKGCWYLDLEESLCPDGTLSADYASDDGLHLNKEGYMAWLEYLITHAAYDPENPYVGGIDPGA